MVKSSNFLHEMTAHKLNFGEEVRLVFPKGFDCGIYTTGEPSRPGWEYLTAPIR